MTAGASLGAGARPTAMRAAAFLDLQGTLGGDGLGDILDFTFYPCAPAAIRALNDAGLLAIVVTNQSRIARGRFTLADFERRVGELTRELAAQGARLDRAYCCPHSPQDGCACRKPAIGMLLRAKGDFGVDLARCYVVGDIGQWEVAMARNAGCHAILVRTGLGEGSLGEYRHTWADLEPDYVAEDILDAARWIVGAEAAQERPVQPRAIRDA